MKNGADINETTLDGATCLHKCAENGRLDVLRHIMIEHQVDINVKKKNGKTALYIAAVNGKIEVVKELVENGTNINVEAEDKEGMTPLLASCFFVEVEVVKYLVDNGANLMAKTNDGTNCLILASGMMNLRWRENPSEVFGSGDCGNATAFKELLEINEVII